MLNPAPSRFYVSFGPVLCTLHFLPKQRLLIDHDIPEVWRWGFLNMFTRKKSKIMILLHLVYVWSLLNANIVMKYFAPGVTADWFPLINSSVDPCLILVCSLMDIIGVFSVHSRVRKLNVVDYFLCGQVMYLSNNPIISPTRDVASLSRLGRKGGKLLIGKTALCRCLVCDDIKIEELQWLE